MRPHTFIRCRAAVVLALAAITTGACSRDASGPDGATARLRLINGSSATVDLRSDGDVVASGVPASTVSSFAAVPAGSHHLTLLVGGQTQGRIDTTLSEGKDYEVVAGGTSSALTAVVGLNSDTASTITDGKIDVWVVHSDSMPGAVPLDVYLTAPGADLGSAQPLPPSTESGPTRVEPGTWEVRFTRQGVVVLDSGPITLDAASVSFLVLSDGNDGPRISILTR